MKTINYIMLVLFFCTGFNAVSQSFYGYNSSRYAGIQGNLFNPALAVQSGYAFDFNLVSVNAYVGSDYFGINVGDISNLDDGFEFDEDATLFPKDDNNFFVNADVVGPSFFFNINDKHSVGLSSRVRGMFNLNNISGKLYEEVSNEFDEDEDFQATVRDFSGTLHAWAEIGLTYAFVASQTETSTLKIGATVKYLQGAGGLFLNADQIDADFDATADTLESTGSLSYGTSQDFDNDDIEFNNLSSGLGFDIGAVYETRKDSLSDYTLRLGVSITDIGSISYDDAQINTYNLNNTVPTSIFEEDDLEESLDENYDKQTTEEAAKIGLPTALRLFTDYNVKKKFYVSLESTLSLKSIDKESSNRVLSYATITPRLEGRGLAIYSPISIVQHTGFQWGAGFKLGPLTIGSNGILTNLLSDSSKGTDIFFGLKVPIYKRKEKVIYKEKEMDESNKTPEKSASR